MRRTRIDRLFIICLVFHLYVCTAVADEKVCKGDVMLDSGNIDSFKDCTIIDGHLNIGNETFTGGKSTPKMDPSELEVFSTVREITGSLSVTASHPDFTDLRYFRNLQTVGEIEGLSGVYIAGTSLKSFRLRSLKRISGVIHIYENNNLCFTEGINWRKLLINFYVWRGIIWHKSLFKPDIELENNRHKDACRADNMVCHEKCSEEDGCWGPGVDECLSCKGFSLEGTCLESCSYPGIYQSGDKTCAKCHEECDGNCYGPGPGNCMKCPSMTFKMNGDCVQCNETCVGGCTGPGDFLGSGGCDKVMVRNNNRKQDDARGRTPKTDEPCEEGYFSEWVSVTGTTKSWKSICSRCHPSCKNCTGYGSHLSVCNECARFRSEEQCEDQCPDEYYADNTTMRCIRCSPECKGCRGPGSDQCESCRNFKVPHGDNITHEFYCSDTCPEDKPHIRQDQGGSYCSAEDPVEEINTPAIGGGVVVGITIIGGVVAGVIIIGVIRVVSYVCRRWLRTCLRTEIACQEGEPPNTPDEGNSEGRQDMWSQTIQELTDRDMANIAEHLANKNWMKVGRKLAVPNDRLDEIESKYNHDYRECAVQMLRIWRESYPNCTLQDLFNALRELRMESTIKQIERIDFSKYMAQK